MPPKLVQISAESLRVGEPLPFPLFDGSGVLLATKGFVFTNRGEIQTMLGRGGALFIDAADSDLYNRAFVGMLHGMVLREATIGEIAGVKLGGIDADLTRNTDPDIPVGPPDWLDYQTQANTMLRDTTAPMVLPRLVRIQKHVRQHAIRNPDGALFALFHLSASEIRMYSATHALLVSVMCGLAAREVLNWPEEAETSLCLAALTMNIGMTDLQDRLAQQLTPPTPEQRQTINQHPRRSVELLQTMGVKDQAWLEAVLNHHSVPSGPLAPRSPGMRMARLIQRADMFGARLAPRASRTPTSPASAMQASYFDENRKVDEAGAAIIKAVGIYSPGSMVKLQTEEIAAVIRRGANTTTPKVAVLVNRDGLPLVEPVVRDTAHRDFRIVASVPHREVKVQINLQRMLALTAPTNG